MSRRCPEGARMFLSLGRSSHDVRYLLRKCPKSAPPPAELLADIESAKASNREHRRAYEYHQSSCEACAGAS